MRYLEAEVGQYWPQAYLASVSIEFEGVQPKLFPCDCCSH